MPFNFLDPINFRNQTYGKKKESNPYKGLFTPQEEEEEQGDSSSDNPFSSSSSPMLDLYKKQLEQMPQKESYKNGKIRSILAGIAGFSTGDAGSAYKTTKGILDAPYEEDLGRWGQKIKQTGELADLEERKNATNLKNYLDYEKLKDDRENNKSLRAYRGVQSKNLESQIGSRGRTTLKDDSTGMTNIYDKDFNNIFSTKTDLTPKEKTTNALSEYLGKEEIRVPSEKTLDTYRTNNDIRAHQIGRDYDISHLAPENRVVDDKITGHTGVMNLNDPELIIKDIGQTDESLREKTIREADKRLADEASENRKAAFRNDLEQGNIKLRAELDKMSETQKTAAYDQAFKETLLEAPQFGKFFDATGSPDPTAIKNEDDKTLYNAMISAVRSKLEFKFGAKKSVGNPLSPRGKIVTPKKVTDDDAKKELIKRGKVVTPESIAMAKQLLESGAQ